MSNAVLGIDVGKVECHAALLTDDRTERKVFPNSRAGLVQLDTWLRRLCKSKVRVCMESTGGYSEGIALHLHATGHKVSVVNPSRIKAYGQSELLRTKTDAIDASLIARFCRSLNPDLWTPLPQEIRELQGLIRHLDTLEDARSQQQNRIDSPTVSKAVSDSLRRLISVINEEITAVNSAIESLFEAYASLADDRNLLVSIPGIGAKTAARIIGEIPNIASFRSSKAAVSFAGLSPAHRQSGTSSKATHISKAGNGRLRHALYFPAIVAWKHNPSLRTMAERLLTRGKPKMVVVCALMRKLLTIAYAVLKSRIAFNPSLLASSA